MLRSNHAIPCVWTLVIAAAGLSVYFDERVGLILQVLPAGAIVLVGMLLTDAIMVRRTGICAMRHGPAIRRGTDAAAFRTQLAVQYATTVVVLALGLAAQVAMAFL